MCANKVSFSYSFHFTYKDVLEQMSGVALPNIVNVLGGGGISFFYFKLDMEIDVAQMSV